MVPVELAPIWQSFSDLFVSPWSFSPVGPVALLYFPILVTLFTRLGLAFDYSNAFNTSAEKHSALFAWSQTVFPKKVFRSKSFKQDLKLTFANILISAPLAYLAIPFLDADDLMHKIADHASPLLHLSFSESTASPSFGLDFTYILAMSLAFDLGSWIAHFSMHKIPMLWEFHKVHHSAEYLTGFTNSRSHFLDEILYTTCGAFFMALAYIVFCTLTGTVPSGYANHAVLIFIWIVLGPLTILFHSHLWVSLGPMEYVFQSPAMHAIHHSSNPKHFNKNLGSTFAVFDFLFGTLYRTTRRPEEILRLGVDDPTDWNSLSLWRLYTTPIKNNIAMVSQFFNKRATREARNIHSDKTTKTKTSKPKAM